MTMIYVVLGNWCDDVWIEGVYSTIELAELALKEGKPINANNAESTQFYIEVYTLDAMPNQQNQP